MPVCKQCGLKFAERQIIDGRERNLKRRSYCTNCVPYKTHITNAKRDKQNGLYCLTCGTPLVGSKTKYCASCEKGTNTNAFSNQKQRAKERKFELIKLLGGCCQRCGYKRNAAALTFHHLRDKSFAMDARSIANRAWELLITEAEKCELLCLNCHMKLHSRNETRKTDASL